jgi:hypothetical protein
MNEPDHLNAEDIGVNIIFPILFAIVLVLLFGDIGLLIIPFLLLFLGGI